MEDQGKGGSDGGYPSKVVKHPLPKVGSQKGVEIPEELSVWLLGSSKDVVQMPTQRRNAIQFKYDGMPDDYSMQHIGKMLGCRPPEETRHDSSSLRTLHNTPSDSWEIELCVGFAVRMIIVPRWEQVKALGRCLIIFKVHKEPKICEMFFMKNPDVTATYKERMPQAIEWANLYDMSAEIAFWAELYRPTDRRGGHRSTSSKPWLTNELCGGFGSRFCIPSQFICKEKWVETLLQISQSPEDNREFVKDTVERINKNQKKQERKKQKKREARAAAAKEAEQEVDDKGACVVCLDAPSTYVFEACKHLCLCRTCAASLLDQCSQPASKKAPKVCPLCREESRLVHIDNFRGDGDDVFGGDVLED